MPSLYEALKTHQRKHTFVFTAFAEEETGLYGSSRYVSQLSKAQLSSIRAFVNLECLGLGETEVWATRADPALLRLLLQVAEP